MFLLSKVKYKLHFYSSDKSTYVFMSKYIRNSVTDKTNVHISIKAHELNISMAKLTTLRALPY